MVLQARNKHRDAAPRPPRPARASPPPLSGTSEVGAGEPGLERAPPSPGRRGAAGRKGPRAETAAPAPDGLAGRLAVGLRWALGLRRGRGRTWSTLLLGEPVSSPLRLFPGRSCLFCSSPFLQGAQLRAPFAPPSARAFKNVARRLSAARLAAGGPVRAEETGLMPAATVHSAAVLAAVSEDGLLRDGSDSWSSKYSGSCLRKLPNL